MKNNCVLLEILIFFLDLARLFYIVLFFLPEFDKLGVSVQSERGAYGKRRL